jgi:hypothetical protein
VLSTRNICHQVLSTCFCQQVLSKAELPKMCDAPQPEIFIAGIGIVEGIAAETKS